LSPPKAKVGQIIHVLRLAVTGKGRRFSGSMNAAILGRESVLMRIDHAVREAGR